MGKTFQKIHGCAVGSFKGNGDKIPQWIRANGGTFSKEINTDVTHLITTKEMYKANADAVKAAKLLGGVKIVTYDWLEDSLLSKNRKPKREKPYLLETLLKDEMKKEKAAKKRGAKGKQDEGSNSKKRKGDDTEKNGRVVKSKSPNYHPYIEKETGMAYSATLVRPTIVPNRREKYQIEVSHYISSNNQLIYPNTPEQSWRAFSIFETQPPLSAKKIRVPIDNPRVQRIQVYESNKEPRVYVTYLKYSRVGKSSIQLLAPLGSKLDLALKTFKSFFKLKTGVEWAERFEDKPHSPKEDSEGQVLPAHECWFHHEKQMSLLASFMRQGPVEVVDEAEVGSKGRASRSTSMEADELRIEEDTVISNELDGCDTGRAIESGQH